MKSKPSDPQPVFEVLSPVGLSTSAAKQVNAARLDTLNGKTVCEIWNCEFKGDVSFPMIREMLQKRFPSVNIIPYTEMPLSDTPLWHGTRVEETAKMYRAVLKEKGADAIISGNGG